MQLKRTCKRILSCLLIICMTIGMLPVSVFAVENQLLLEALKKMAGTVNTRSMTMYRMQADAQLTAALEEAGAYIDALTVGNVSNDPKTVVSTHGTHFTWDNEKRESSKTYLYDWSYYNGVVFEGLEYLYEVTGDEKYKDYVVEYMSNLIASDGSWAVTTNNDEKTAAGYVNTHGADCYKTASLLLDTYEMTGDERYLDMAETLYADLDTAAENYLLPNAGNNFHHTWATASNPNLWLDGLYMILPFRAEYARAAGDAAELNLIVDRMQWVSQNMYDPDTGLFYHAANSVTTNSGTFWLRSIGWYAAAIVDVMSSMEGDSLDVMKSQLIKLVEGMKYHQDETTGMWLNNLVGEHNEETNPYETSGTALFAYAVLKAVNNGWLDEGYADIAIRAFEGICEHKLEGNTLTDICFKGTPGKSNSTFYDNEGKGVGPFIMLYSQVVKCTQAPQLPEVTGKTFTHELPSGEQITIVAPETVTALTITENTGAEFVQTALRGVMTGYVSYDIVLEGYVQGQLASVTLPIPDGVVNPYVYHIPESGKPERISCVNNGDGTVSFITDHFSSFAVGVGSVSGSGELPSIVYSVSNNTTNNIQSGSYYVFRSAVSSNPMLSGESSSRQTTYNNSTFTVNGQKLTTDGVVDGDVVWYVTRQNGNYYVQQGGPDGQYLTLSSWGAALQPQSRELNLSYNNNNGGYWDIQDRSTSQYLNWVDGPNSETAAGTQWSGSQTENSRWRAYPVTVTHGNTGAGGKVTFTIEPGSLYIQTGTRNNTLTGTVTVNGQTVDLSSCDITWNTEESDIATVTKNASGAVVTGVKAGATNVYATLRSVNGRVLSTPIVLYVPVVVANRLIQEFYLDGIDPVTVQKGTNPNFSNIEMKVTYNDGTTGTITINNGLAVSGYNKDRPGTYYAEINYGGMPVGTIRVTVEGDPYAGLDKAESYPHYPDDGAVRIDKTANANAHAFGETGVTHVELDVAGISIRKGVDVVLVLDISNSMAWSLENSDKAEADRMPDRAAGQLDKLEHALNSLSTFADILLTDNDGELNDNTLSLVTFAGYDQQNNTSTNSGNIDSVREVFRTELDNVAVKRSFANTKFTSNNTSYTIQIADTNGNVITEGSNRGNTNYDYAFWEADRTVEAIKAENTAAGKADREVYVVFITDGAPSHYNDRYNSGTHSSDRIPGTTTRYPGENYSQDGWLKYIQDTTNRYVSDLYDEVDGHIYAIGFDLAHGGFGNKQWTEAQLRPVLENMAGGGNRAIEVMTTADHIELNDFYRSLAIQIKNAGTQAKVTDVIDSKFSLQMGNFSGSGNKKVDLSNYGHEPKIMVRAYDLWDAKEVTALTDLTAAQQQALIGTRKVDKNGAYIFEVLEEITFNAEGTQAYSTMLDGSHLDVHHNIMTVSDNGTVVIDAEYFHYTKDATGVETFEWMLGDITMDEVVLSYDVYLKESMEGGREEGIYDTNEGAVLEYIDVNDDYAVQEFPVPQVVWGGAATTIRYYLVNDNGEPVNYNGVVVPWANRVYVGEPVTIPLYLNSSNTFDAKTIEADAYITPEYELYDENAYYQVTPGSGNGMGSLVIAAPGSPFKEGVQTTRLIDAEEKHYTWSTVAFGVRWANMPKFIEPMDEDVIVLDYGKAIRENVWDEENEDSALTADYNVVLVGFAQYDPYKDLSAALKTDRYNALVNDGTIKTQWTSANGTYTIAQAGGVAVAQFKLSRMLSEIEKIFCVVKMTNKTNAGDTYYAYNPLTIIPATSVYYETDFNGGYENWFVTSTPSNPGQLAGATDISKIDFGKWSVYGTSSDDLQDDGSIGYHQTYGYDSSYTNDSGLSNGSSLFVHGQGMYLTTAKFEFTGTGFDLISRTGVDQGAIRVDIYQSEDAREQRAKPYKSITVLNKSEAGGAMELYQIPVASINNLPHGTYYVTVGVNAAYNTTDEGWSDLNRGDEFYFDALRVFEPLGKNEEAKSAYWQDGEDQVSVNEVRGMLLDQGSFDYESTSNNSVVLVDRGPNDKADIGLYSQIGPNNETYLVRGQGIAFQMNVNTIPASFDVGAKTILNGSARLNVRIMNASDKRAAFQRTVDIASCTAQNIDVFANANNLNSVFEGGSVIVLIENTGNAYLSITDLKVGFGKIPAHAIQEMAVQQDQAQMNQLALLTATNAFDSAEELDSAADQMGVEVDPFAIEYLVGSGMLAQVNTLMKKDFPAEQTAARQEKGAANQRGQAASGKNERGNSARKSDLEMDRNKSNGKK